MSLYSDLRKTINQEGTFSSAHKRVLRAIAKAAFGVGQGSLANQAGAAFKAAAPIYEVAIEENGNLVTTRILVDLTTLRSGDAGDVIGPAAAAAAVYKVTEAENGTVMGASLRCLETPATGDTDIDLVTSATGTTVEDAAPTSGSTLINSGGIAAGGTYGSAVWVAAKPFIYLVGATGADAAYTTGIVEITLFGYRA